jgi:hypothetical protein
MPLQKVNFSSLLGEKQIIQQNMTLKPEGLYVEVQLTKLSLY